MKYLLPAVLLLNTSGTFADTHMGEKTYAKACANCHAPRLAEAISAPAAHDIDAWQARWRNAVKEAKANPQSFPDAQAYMVSSVKIGKGLMHHGGLCKESMNPKTDCTDAAYLAAIKYMSLPKEGAGKK